MSKLKKALLFPPTIFVLSVMLGITIIAVYSHFAPKEPMPFEVQGDLNDYKGEITVSNSNINKTSFIIPSEDKYYLMDYPQLSELDKNTKKITKLTSDTKVIKFINDDTDYIYYLSCDESSGEYDPVIADTLYYGGTICRIDKSSNKTEKVAEIDGKTIVLNFFKIGDCLYYIAQGDENGLFRIRMDNQKAERLLYPFSNQVNYYNNRIYYLDHNKYDVKSINLLGEDEQLLWDNNEYQIQEFVIDNGNMYYMVKHSDGKERSYESIFEISVMNMKTNKTKSLIKEELINSFSVTKEKIYYTMPNEDENTDEQLIGDILMSYDIKTGEKKVVDDCISFQGINIQNDKLYYCKEKVKKDKTLVTNIIQFDGKTKIKINN